MPKIVVRPDGVVHLIYTDELQPLLKQGQAHIRRASHVEPVGNTQWQADMSPVAGPTLGPFETRQQALDAEVQWLEQNIL